MAVQKRKRAPRRHESKSTQHYYYRVVWKLNGDGPWQSVTVGDAKGHAELADDLNRWLKRRGFKMRGDDPRVAAFLAGERAAAGEPEPEPEDDDEPGPTVGQLVDKWLAAPKRKRNPNTARTYAAIRKLLGPFGDMPASKVTEDDINAWFGALDDRGAKASSQRLRLTVLRGSLKGHTDPEAFAGVSYPDDRAVTQDKALTEDQLADLLAHADPAMVLPIKVGAALGLRPGELCGLTAGKVDLDTLTVHVDLQLRGDNLKRHGFATEPVKHGSARPVPMQEGLADALALVRDIQATYGPHAPVFTHDDGDYWSYAQWWRAWRMLVARTPSVPNNLTPHALRHTFAIYWLREGAGLGVVSEWLGHSDIKVTHQHYGRFSPDAARAFMVGKGMALA